MQIKDFQIQRELSCYQTSTVYQVVNTVTLENQLITKFRVCSSRKEELESLEGKAKHINLLAWE